MKRLLAFLCALLLPSLAWATDCSYTGIFASPSVKFYASTSGSDAGNFCTSQTYPCTLQGAVNQAAFRSITDTNLVSVALAAGAYTSGIEISGAQPSQSQGLGGSFIGLCGIGGSGSVSITDSSQPATIVATDGMKLALRGLTIKSAAGSALFPSRNAFIYLDTDMVFGQTVKGMLHPETGAVIEIGNGFTVDGTAGGLTAPSIFQPRLNGRVIMDEVTQSVTLTNSPSFTYFADAEDLGLLYVPSTNVTFSGAVGANGTGARYFVGGNATIQTNAGSETYFPGLVAGSFATGGKYEPAGNPSIAAGFTGLGTGGTATTTGGADRRHGVHLTAGTGAGSSGTVAVNFATIFNGVGCTAILAPGSTGGWAAGATVQSGGITISSSTLKWNNNGTNLTSGSDYFISEVCNNP